MASISLTCGVAAADQQDNLRRCAYLSPNFVGSATGDNQRRSCRPMINNHIALPSIQRLNELLEYDPDTGSLRWRVFRRGNAKPDARAGGVKENGYRRIGIDGIRYLEHRICYVMAGNPDPGDCQIDHIDHDPGNNRASNLRLATNSQNLWNLRLTKRNSSGVKGVYYQKSRGKFLARVTKHNRCVFSGRFNTIEEAAEAVKKARSTLHKHFTNHGE
jgi:hypothetical protein